MPISGSSSIANQASLAQGTNKTTDTEFLTTDVDVGLRSDRSGKLRTTISMDAAAIFEVTLNSGTTWVELNSGAILGANQLFVFDVPIFSGDKINFRYKATANVNVFRVDEVLMEG